MKSARWVPFDPLKSGATAGSGRTGRTQPFDRLRANGKALDDTPLSPLSRGDGSRQVTLPHHTIPPLRLAATSSPQHAVGYRGSNGLRLTLRQAPFDPVKSGAGGWLRANGSRQVTLPHHTIPPLRPAATSKSFVLSLSKDERALLALRQTQGERDQFA